MSKSDKKTPAKKKTAARRKRKHDKSAASPAGAIALPKASEQPKIFWQSAAESPLYRPIKKQVTFRLDADVLAWLRKDGKGYQTKANALLREWMLKEVSRKK